MSKENVHPSKRHENKSLLQGLIRLNNNKGRTNGPENKKNHNDT